MSTLALRKYTRANPDPNPTPVVDNLNLISRRVKRQEILVSLTPSIKVDSCPDEWLFLEDISFDFSFDLSLFRTKSETALDDTVLDTKFVADLEIQKANKSIDEYILNSPQSSITAANIPELLESTLLNW